MLSVNEFIDEVNVWLTASDVPVDVDVPENESELQPHDSMSNVATNVTRNASSCGA